MNRICWKITEIFSGRLIFWLCLTALKMSCCCNSLSNLRNVVWNVWSIVCNFLSEGTIPSLRLSFALNRRLASSALPMNSNVFPVSICTSELCKEGYIKLQLYCIVLLCCMQLKSQGLLFITQYAYSRFKLADRFFSGELTENLLVFCWSASRPTYVSMTDSEDWQAHLTDVNTVFKECLFSIVLWWTRVMICLCVYCSV